MACFIASCIGTEVAIAPYVRSMEGIAVLRRLSKNIRTEPLNFTVFLPTVSKSIHLPEISH
jgi:hypothetical protein